MIDKIAQLILDEINSLNWVEKTAGVVQAVRYSTKGEAEEVIPVYLNDIEPCDESTYMDLVPDDSKKSIIYFESGDIDTIDSSCSYQTCESVLRLVCWANLKNINADYTDANLLKVNLIQTIPKRLPNTDWVTKILLSFEGEVKKSPEIFSAYTYNESRYQYLMYPFDYFALNYRARFSIPMDSSCLDEIILNPSIC